jgi:hypothetical protein
LNSSTLFNLENFLKVRKEPIDHLAQRYLITKGNISLHKMLTRKCFQGNLINA